MACDLQYRPIRERGSLGYEIDDPNSDGGVVIRRWRVMRGQPLEPHNSVPRLEGSRNERRLLAALFGPIAL